MKTLVLSMAALTAAAGLAGCGEPAAVAPREPGVCWHMPQAEEGQAQRFNRVRENVASLEDCAAALEQMRLRFRALGGGQEELTGAYQGQFLFLRRAGIYTAPRLTGQQYLVLVRTADGRLARMGAVQPPPQP